MSLFMLFQQNILLFSFFFLEHQPNTILNTREHSTCVNVVLLSHMENRCGANKSH
jgi:hypothetical protein